MAETRSTMLELGTTLPSFRLQDIDGRAVTSDDFARSKGLLVAFWCAHCHYVRHIRAEFARFTQDFQRRGPRSSRLIPTTSRPLLRMAPTA